MWNCDEQKVIFFLLSFFLLFLLFFSFLTFIFPIETCRIHFLFGHLLLLLLLERIYRRSEQSLIQNVSPFSPFETEKKHLKQTFFTQQETKRKVSDDLQIPVKPAHVLARIPCVCLYLCVVCVDSDVLVSSRRIEQFRFGSRWRAAIARRRWRIL